MFSPDLPPGRLPSGGGYVSDCNPAVRFSDCVCVCLCVWFTRRPQLAGGLCSLSQPVWTLPVSFQCPTIMSQACPKPPPKTGPCGLDPAGDTEPTPFFPVYVCVCACASFLPLKASFLPVNERPPLCAALPSIL